MDIGALIRQAIEAREFAYAPYSDFCVVAALLTKAGRVYTGCNIENGGFSATNCAERTAFFKAVSEGERGFAAIAIVGGPRGELTDYCSACGVCRQVMAEFCDPEEFLVIHGITPEDYKIFTLRQMLPEGGFPASGKGNSLKPAHRESQSGPSHRSWSVQTD